MAVPQGNIKGGSAMPDELSKDRRKFLRKALFTATALPIVGYGVTAARPALASDPQAEDGHALAYVNDAADAAGHEAYEEGQLCENCIFWSGEEADGWGGCMHPDFEGVLVNAQGWCEAYLPQA
jgi:hypothetical protein